MSKHLITFHLEFYCYLWTKFSIFEKKINGYEDKLWQCSDSLSKQCLVIYIWISFRYCKLKYRYCVTAKLQVIRKMFILGDIVNRRIVDYFAQMTSPETLCSYLESFKQSLWPNGTYCILQFKISTYYYHILILISGHQFIHTCFQRFFSIIIRISSCWPWASGRKHQNENSSSSQSGPVF